MNYVTVARRGVYAALGSLLLSASAGAQVTLADYERAAVFQNARELVSRQSVEPHWIHDSDRFWYLDEHEQTKTFVLVEPARNRQAPAFDHARLAAALSSQSGTQYRAEQLPFDAIEFDDGVASILFKVAAGSSETRWRCELSGYTCAVAPPAGAREGEALSPNGRWAVFSRAYNLWVRDTATGEETALTDDGEENYDYGSKSGISYSAITDRLLGRALPPEVNFSPDSRLILSYRIDAREMQELGLVQTVMGGKPVTHTYRYPMTGDEKVARAQMILFDLEKKTRLPLKLAPLLRLTNYDMQVCWDKNATHVCFTEDERGYKTTKLHLADTRTGEVRTVFEERSATYVNRFPQVQMVGEGDGFVWSSERDGWNHLYSLDARDGAIKRQLTRGEWVVRGIVHFDEKRRTLYFTASGKEPTQDLYYQHLYSVQLDGTGLKHLTPESAFHDIKFSPTGRYFVDNYSRVDAAPISVLRAADGRSVRELQRADIGKLQAAGWRAPEPFSVKARDGKTDLYGAIFRPSNFDPSRRYPVLDAIYPGPQAIRTPKAFDVKEWEPDQAIAELGFIVITIDGMGTPWRSRAFRDVAYGNLGDAGGLADHIAGIRQLARRYSYLDLDRVGIYGHSGGGYASARALLKFPEFYKVAVAASGDHDLRSYWAEWGERFHGYPVGENFDDQANAPLASRLVGKLLLAHGDLDDNVHPAGTLQLVNALIAANKDFDLLVLPNRNHLLMDLGKGKAAAEQMDPYFLRRRWDYFVEHLLGQRPPKEFSLRLGEP